MERDIRVKWPHKDLLDTAQLALGDVVTILDTAASFEEINARTVKKVPTLKGRSVILFFAEPSTRTKMSFDIAGKRLSADTFSLTSSGSSLQKGESLKDTGLTLQAMSPDAIIVRHNMSGAAHFLAEQLECSVINAGDGWHAHPTQALLDAYTLRCQWGGFKGRTLVILGDVAHSRVARSNVDLLTALGVKIRLCAPFTLLPPGVREWPVSVYTDLRQAVRGVDAVMCLRLQFERQQAGLLPDLREYARTWCLTAEHLALARSGVRVLHPGPMNRGLEIASDLADAVGSLVLNQVAAGVAVRMAVLFLCITRTDRSQR
ncbi:Aspartate carbamoyltransferase [Desulfovibrionales bacterium]